jgi:hypothetical protein
MDRYPRLPSGNPVMVILFAVATIVAVIVEKALDDRD